MKLDRLSPSQLVLYKNNPCLWLGKYHFGWTDEVGPAAWRGSAVEAGLNAALGTDVRLVDRCLPHAVERFELDAQGLADDNVVKHRELIEPMLSQAVMACGSLPAKPMQQVRCDHYLDGVSVPLLCFVDYDYPDFLFDLKTTERIPTEPKGDHVLQCAIYSAARKKPARLLYVSGKKSQWFELTDEQIAEGLADARRAAQAIVALCEDYATPERAARTMVPDFSEFRWSETTKQKALEVWP